MWFADGDKVRGFKSMLFNQFTGIGLQKDDNAFIKFNETTGGFDDRTSVDNIHSDSKAKYKLLITITSTSRASNNAYCQIVSNFSIGYSRQYVTETGGEMSVTGSTSNFGQSAQTLPLVTEMKPLIRMISDISLTSFHQRLSHLVN